MMMGGQTFYSHHMASGHTEVNITSALQNGMTDLVRVIKIENR